MCINNNRTHGNTWVHYPPISVTVTHKELRIFAFFCYQPIKTNMQMRYLKGPYANHILIPQGSTGSSIFFDIKWKPIFFWLQIQNFSFKFFVVLEIQQKVKLIGIPENNFLCIFIIASSPGVHSFFCLWRVNKKLPQGETSQNAFQRSRSIN